MANKYALILGNNNYQDKNLAKLSAPVKDVNDLVGLLGDPSIGQFDEVKQIKNAKASSAQRAIASFFSKRKRDDLLLLYFSGHSILNDEGELYLAFQDTEYDLLSGTGIPTNFLTQEMNRCQSKRQVLILDCCYSGAFTKGTKSAIGTRVGVSSAFKGTGYGRVVLTASDSTQYAWEGKQFIGEAENSLFTHYLIEGIKTGKADLDQDGWVSLDELYEYVHERVLQKTPKQTPGKWSYKQEGDILIAKNPKVFSMQKLPKEIVQAMGNPLAAVRKAIVGELAKLLDTDDPSLNQEAFDALERLTEDDSDEVSQAATASVEVFQQKQLEREKEEKEKEIEKEIETGSSLLSQGLYVEALSIFEKVLPSAPDNEALHDLISQCNAALQEQDQIKEYFSTGKTKFENGEYKEAKLDFEQLLVLQPDHPESLEFISRIQKKSLQMELVQQLIEEAESNLNRKKFGQAATTFRRALDMDPQNQVATLGLKRAQEGLVPGSQTDSHPSEDKQQKSSRKPIIAILTVIVALIAGAWYFSPFGDETSLAINEINLSGPASTARTEMLNEKSNAIKAGADKNAAETYKKAIREEEKGNQEAKQGKHWDAKQSYDMAREYFIMAIEGAEIKSLSPAEAEKKALENRLKRPAIAAKREMVRMQSEARDAQSEKFASKTFNQARAASQKGDRQYNNQEFEAATASFTSASNLFKSARNQAKEKILAAEKDITNLKKLVNTVKVEMLDEKLIAEQLGGESRTKNLFAKARQKEEAADAEYRKGNKAGYVAAQTLYTESKEAYEEVSIEVGKLNQRERDAKAAQAAKANMTQAKRNVGANKAEEIALPNYQKALIAESNAEKQIIAGKFEAAKSKFEEAENFYAQAKTDLPTLRTKIEADKVEAAKLEKARLAEEALKNKPAASVTAEQNIQNMINQYKKGFEGEDFNLLQPFVAPGADKIWSPFFRDAENIKANIENKVIDITGDRANVSFNMRMNYFNTTVKKSKEDVLPISWKLELIDGNWKVIQ